MSDILTCLRQVIERYELPARITANQNLLLLDIEPSWKADIVATLGALQLLSHLHKHVELSELCSATVVLQSCHPDFWSPYEARADMREGKRTQKT